MVQGLSLLLLCHAADSGAQESGQSPVPLLAPAAGVVLERGTDAFQHATLAEALAAARTDDVLRLAPGTHRGPVVLDRPGLVLRGEPGARIDGNESGWTPQWTPAPQFGRHAFTTPIPFAPGGVTLDDRALIDARESRGGLSIHADGVGRGGRSVLQGLFTWIEKQGLLLVSFAQPLNPLEHRLDVSRRNTATVTIRDADRCRVENLILTGGDAGIRFERTRDSVARNCLVYAVDAGVVFGPAATGCRVQSCDITWNPDALGIDCDPASGLAGDDAWKAHKQFGTYDKYGILATCSGEGNEVDGCYLYNVWDGISTADGVGKDDVREHFETYVFKGISRFNRGMKVHHTRIDLALDDAMEPGNELVGAEWHHNVMTRARCGVRFKTLTLGPFFFHNNVVTDCGNGLRLYKSTPECATLFVAHNVIRDKTGIIYHDMGSVCWDDPWLADRLPRGTPGFRLYNNLFVCDTPFANYDGNVPPNFQGDGNLYTASDRSVLHQAGIDTHGTFGVTPQFADPEHGDWQLRPESPGQGAGVRLGEAADAPWPAALLSASGETPDCGLASPDGTPTPHGPVSGLWPMASQRLNLGERAVESFRMDAQRWIAAASAEYPLSGLSGREDVVLRVVRAGTGKTRECRAAVRDTAGQTVAEAVHPPSREVVDLRVVIPADRQSQALRLAVSCDEETQWRIESISGAARIGIDFATPVSVRKYDGGRYGLDYDVPDPAPASFRATLRKRFEAPCRLEVIRPGSAMPEEVADGLIATGGVSGTYRLLLTFTKRADFSIEGQPSIALLAQDQETPPLRPHWGKPNY